MLEVVKEVITGKTKDLAKCILGSRRVRQDNRHIKPENLDLERKWNEQQEKT